MRVVLPGAGSSLSAPNGPRRPRPSGGMTLWMEPKDLSISRSHCAGSAAIRHCSASCSASSSPTAPSGEQAWEIFQQDDPPSLAILDWTMPGMDGLELCTRVRTMGREPKPYLIFVTAKARTQDIVTGLGAGADDYIVKPFEREELHARVQVGFRMLELQAALADRVRELEEALTRVKQLQGLLPICSSCKKVRHY